MKRARPSFQVSQKRPIDKSLIYVAKSSVTAQVSTDLVTATFPCTITGLRWNIENKSASSTAIWAIILVKDGNSANTMAFSDGATMYEPEQNVLAWGVISVGTDNGGEPAQIGTTKSMRKLMGGDKLVFITAAVAGTADITGGIQFFCKS